MSQYGKQKHKGGDMSSHQWNMVQPKMRGLWQDAVTKMTDVNASVFNGKHQACPSCGGKDRFRFTDYIRERGDGGAICAQCGAGDGLHWFMKITGYSFFDAINALGDYLNLVPAEKIISAKKQIKSQPNNLYSASMEPEDAESIMKRCVDSPVHVYTLACGIAPEPLYVLNKTVTNGECKKFVIDSRICVPVARIDKFPEKNNEPDTVIANVTMIDHAGRLSWPCGKDEWHPEGRMTYGSVAVIGKNVKKSIYLCADWVDAWHVHYATGAQVWCTFTTSNLESVAYLYPAECHSGKLRIACNLDFDELCEAEKRMCQVIIPAGDEKISVAREFKKVIYNPAALLDEFFPNGR